MLGWLADTLFVPTTVAYHLAAAWQSLLQVTTAIAHCMFAWLHRSKVIQNLPPVIFTLMKSTEPHSDVYYTFDVEVKSALPWYRQCLAAAACTMEQ